MRRRPNYCGVAGVIGNGRSLVPDQIFAEASMFDTYFALLERPELRQLGATRYQIRHRPPFFSQQVYESSSGIVFGSETEAYRHWLEIGRQQGLEWSEGK